MAWAARDKFLPRICSCPSTEAAPEVRKVKQTVPVPKTKFVKRYVDVPKQVNSGRQKQTDMDDAERLKGQQQQLAAVKPQAALPNEGYYLEWYRQTVRIVKVDS